MWKTPKVHSSSWLKRKVEGSVYFREVEVRLEAHAKPDMDLKIYQFLEATTTKTSTTRSEIIKTPMFLSIYLFSFWSCRSMR